MFVNSINILNTDKELTSSYEGFSSLTQDKKRPRVRNRGTVVCHPQVVCDVYLVCMEKICENTTGHCREGYSKS